MVIVVLAVGGALYLVRPDQPAAGGPSPTPGVSVSPTSGVSASPSEIVEPKPALFVFSRAVGDEPRLWVANADGTGAHELAPDLGGCQGMPAWSPDGTRLLFSRIQCSSLDGVGDASTRLYLTDASGNEPQMVDSGCVSPCAADSNGVFSTDGRRILFLRLKIVDAPPSATPGLFGKPARPAAVRVLATMDLATGRVTELGDLPAASSFPSWSPDRSQIVFDRDIPPASPSEQVGSREILVADADGRNVHQVSPGGWSSFSADWSPDGTRILFQGIRYTSGGPDELHGSTDIYTINPDGTDLRKLTTDEISSQASWSPDGRIWFVRSLSDPPAQYSPYWVMDADGSNMAQLTGPPLQGLLQPTP